jgi:methionine synthase I (cobalamin-dependent)
MAERVREVLVGGRCGTDPEHLTAIARGLAGDRAR